MPSCDLDYRKINATLRQLRSKLVNLEKNADRLKAIAGSKEQTTQRDMITLQSEKLIESLKEHYKDTVEKLTLKTHTPSLVSLAGYAVGTNAASLHEERIEDFYVNIPAHLRQFVLLQHATDILIRSEMILPHLPKFIDVCSNGRAIHQGYRLLQYYWNSKVTLLSTDQQFVARKMIQLGKAEAWTRLQAEHFVYHSKSRRVLGTDGIEVLLRVLKIYHSGNSECYKALNEACMYLLEHSMRNQRSVRSFKKRKFSYSSDPLESSDSEWEDSRSTVLTHQNCQCDEVFDLFFEQSLFKNLSNDFQLLFAMWSIYSLPRRRKEMVDILPQIIALVDCSQSFKKLNWKPKHILFVAEHCRVYPVVSYTLLRAILTVFEGMQFPKAIEKVTQAIMDLKDCSPELCTK